MCLNFLVWYIELYEDHLTEYNLPSFNQRITQHVYAIIVGDSLWALTSQNTLNF